MRPPTRGRPTVFTRTGTSWSQLSYLKGAQTDAGDLFGFCVDVSSDGSTLAICNFDEDGGSPGINGNKSDNSKKRTGPAAHYIFVRNGTGWKQTTQASNNRTLTIHRTRSAPPRNS